MRMKFAFTLAFSIFYVVVTSILPGFSEFIEGPLRCMLTEWTDFFVFFTGVHCYILTLKGVQMASPSREFFH